MPARDEDSGLVRSDEHFGPPDPGCDVCKNNIPFVFPSDLADALIARNVVLFAGAGISTESPYVTKTTMYEDLAAELGVSGEQLAFPSLMSRYVAQRGRTALVEYILTRFDRIAAFPAQEQAASRFHRELAVVPQIEEVVTTNWDDYFERYTFAIPFVVDQDFAYWNLPRRKVFKIHGSVHNVGTLIATDEDYKRRLRELRHGVMGARLKLALATKTIVFVGYSFRDEDFNQLHRYLESQMRDLLPRSYAVTLSTDRAPSFLANRVIKTDGAFFVHRIRWELVKGGAIPSDKRLDDIQRYRKRIDSAHTFILRLGLHRIPILLYSSTFQEGVMHALDRAMHRWPTGEYHDWERLERKMHAYAHLLHGAARVRRYEDVAYIDGYLLGLQVVRGDAQRLGEPPVFYLPGPGYLSSQADVRSLLRKPTKVHKTAVRRAEQIMARYPRNIIPTHTADLSGVPER